MKNFNVYKMEIIKNYWANKEEELKSEKQFSDHLKNFNITNVFIGLKQIKNFKIETNNARNKNAQYSNSRSRAKNRIH